MSATAGAWRESASRIHLDQAPLTGLRSGFFNRITAPEPIEISVQRKRDRTEIGLSLVLVSRSGLGTGRSGAVLVEQTGVGLHEAHKILRLEDSEGSGISSCLRETGQLVAAANFGVDEHRLRMPRVTLHRHRFRMQKFKVAFLLI